VYVVIPRVTIGSGHEVEAEQQLQSEVLPRVKQAPGLVAGYWTRPDAGHGTAFIIFESEQAANAAREMATNTPRPDWITFDSIEIREIVAQI
jgi:hypothetical protein